MTRGGIASRKSGQRSLESDRLSLAIDVQSDNQRTGKLRSDFNQLVNSFDFPGRSGDFTLAARTRKAG